MRLKTRDRWQILVIVLVGFAIVAGLTAIQVAGVPHWVSVGTRVVIGLVALVAGLLINRTVRKTRRGH